MRETAEGEKLALALAPICRRVVRAAAHRQDRSCSLRLSAHDYERLGILAVKTGASRQQLLKQAVAEFLGRQAQDYGCACLSSGGPVRTIAAVRPDRLTWTCGKGFRREPDRPFKRALGESRTAITKRGSMRHLAKC